MANRSSEEAPPSSDSSKTGPNFFDYYRVQVAQLLSQEEKIPDHEILANKKSSTNPIGANISYLKREKLNALLRQCVQDLTPEVDEMQSRASSMQLMNQLNSTSPAHGESVIPGMEEKLRVIMKSDPGVVRNLVRKLSSDIVASVTNMQQQVENILDNVATTCRPMSRDEKKELQKSIKELPSENLKRVAGIIKDHYAALGKDFSEVVVFNMEEEDDIILWRLQFYVNAVKNARKLANLRNS